MHPLIGECIRIKTKKIQKKTIPIKKCRGVFAWEKDEAQEASLG